MANLPYNQFQAYIDGLYQDGELSEKDYNNIILYILANGETENTPRDLIQIRRGNEENLPNLAQGELGFTLDTKKLFVGGLNENVGLPTEEYIENKLAYLPINVKEYGAIGDGITDDTIALQTLLDNENIKTLVFPKGKYKITSPLVIKNNTSIIGDGKQETSIYLDNNTSTSGLSELVNSITQNVNAILVLANHYSFAKISDIKLEGYYTKMPKYGIYGLNVDNVVFSNIETFYCENGSYFGSIWLCTLNHISHFYLGNEGSGLTIGADYRIVGSTTCKISNVASIDGKYPFKISGLSYASFDNCGADTTKEGGSTYWFASCNGINVTSCGSEFSKSDYIFYISNSIINLTGIRIEQSSNNINIFYITDTSNAVINTLSLSNPSFNGEYFIIGGSNSKINLLNSPSSIPKSSGGDAPILADGTSSIIYNDGDKIKLYKAYKESLFSLIEYGSSSEKPLSPPVGSVFFNTTLSKPIWWNGSSWRNSDGSENI